MTLPRWTLSARHDGETIEFSLGDGQRFARRASRPASLLEGSGEGLEATELFGAELAVHLVSGAARELSVQVDARFDAVAWEAIEVGDGTLGSRFTVSRQVISTGEPAALQDTVLADALAVCSLHAADAPWGRDARRVPAAALAEPWARSAVASAHVVLLEAADLAAVLDALASSVRERLLVVGGPPGLRSIEAALDHGASLLALRGGFASATGAVESLRIRLSGGGSVGDAVRGLHQRASRGSLDARLYGDAGMRFVRTQVPTSRRQVTSLSFDLVGSTTLLRSLGDEGYAETLGRVHERCTDVVRKHGGRPDDPQGDDGVMCYFGHPVALENAAVHAAEAALEIVRTVIDLGVSVRVGIATGAVAVLSGQPVGLSIHLAARLQNATAPGTVLASEDTRQLIEHAFELRPLGASLHLKGLDASGSAHLVLGRSSDAGTLRFERRSWLTPLVGRQNEMARLEACWSRALVGESQVALVRADAGMGKSRLVREFRKSLAGSAFDVLECHCRADASSSPYLVLVESLRRWLDLGDGTDASHDDLARLAPLLPEGLGTGEPLALLATLLGLGTRAPHATGEGLRPRLLAALLEWMRLIARDRPFCLIVEDWQWIDPSTREFIEQLVQPQSGESRLVVVTSRGDAAPASAALSRAELIELAGLPPEAARELVRLVDPNTELPVGVVRTLAIRGDGVPLFLEEATRIALQAGADRLEAGTAALEMVPASLQDLLMARLDGLGSARQVAQVAAVIGREFSLPLLTALLETGGFALDAEGTAERLAALVASGLVLPHGSVYTFKHALIRDAAYASLWRRDRVSLHARMVALLQERWPEVTASRPELLALHQTEAGQHRAALAQWELAARSASARSAAFEAVSHLRKALSVLEHLEPGIERERTALRLQLLLAARLITTEGYGAESVLHAYLEAERLCDGIGDDAARFKVEMGLEANRFMRADFGPALDHGRRAAAIAERSGDRRQRLHAHWGLACTLHHQGDLLGTMREMDIGLELYTPEMHPRFGVQDPGIMCLAYSSWGLWELARPDAALARINHAVALAREYRHPFSEAVALAYAVSVELLRGETEPALARAEACIDVCEDAGFPVWLAITRCMRGRLLCERGAFDAGLREMKAGYALWLSTGAMVSQPLCLALQAEGLILAGQPAAALACVDEGLEIVERYGERQLEAELHRLRGELALQAGDRVRGEALLRRAYALAIRRHRLGFALRSATALATTWAQSGREERALRLLAPLVGRWQEGRATRDVRTAAALCASLATTSTPSRGHP